uniref:Uncharacterized protein n=1 Tax=Tanacetum cinerariifolium TaxID=118510 RepID=A0A699GQF7_TANCI|nr:hypothetical protein [Tanacetum cinerariifolium]
MSSASSAVTYTFVYTDFEPGRVVWGAGEELSDGDSPRVIVYGYDGLPMQPVAPPSLDYIPGPEEPQTPPAPQDEDDREPMFIQPHDPDYMPEPMYHEYMPLEDKHSQIHKRIQRSMRMMSQRMVQLTILWTGDDGDDDNGHSSRDDANDEDEEEEGEYLALAGAVVVIHTVEPVSHLREQSLLYHHPLLTLPPLELGSLSGFRLPYPIHQKQRIASTQALIDAVTVALPSPPLPPPLYIPPHVDRRDDIPKIELPPRKKSCLFALGPWYKVRESSTARPTRGRGIDYGFVSTLDAEARRRGIREVGYGIRDTWVDSAEAVLEIAPVTLGEVNTRVTELAELHEHDTQDLYALLEDA